MNHNLQANKALVERYFDGQRSGNLLSALDLFARDFTWTIGGYWEMSGTIQGDEIKKLLEGLSVFDGGLHFDHQAVTAEEDRVAVFTTVRGKLKDGREYKNQIFFQFTIRDGKLVNVLEMPDSATSRAFWLGK